MAGQLVVAPHPDDETIGAAIWMARHRDAGITLLYLTDGSPRDLSDALAAGCPSQESYAAERRRELRDALSLIRIGPEQMRGFSCIDKECHLHIPELISRMVELLNELQPDVVLSPAYEGGHPDHDTAALIVAAARRRIDRPFQLLEYRLYHASSCGAMVTDRFLPGLNHAQVCRLNAGEKYLKRRMLTSFTTQQHILKRFGVDDEQFREAPSYDFAQPPHAGKLLYECWGWAISGEEWRSYAALREGAV